MERKMDIEVAMNLIQLMDGYIEFGKAHGIDNLSSLYVKMVENSLETMTNPYAKKLLLDRMEYVKYYT